MLVVGVSVLVVGVSVLVVVVWLALLWWLEWEWVLRLEWEWNNQEFLRHWCTALAR